MFAIARHTTKKTKGSRRTDGKITRTQIRRGSQLGVSLGAVSRDKEDRDGIRFALAFVTRFFDFCTFLMMSSFSCPFMRCASSASSNSLRSLSFLDALLLRALVRISWKRLKTVSSCSLSW